MKVTVIRMLGCSPARNRWSYVLEAANGLIDVQEADVFIKEGTVLDMPDEEWDINADSYDIRCDGCGHEYTGKTIPGGKLICPVCGQEELVPK